MVWSPHKQGKKFSIILTLLLFTAAKSCLTFLLPHGLYPIGLLCPWDFPGKNTGVGCNFLLQGILPTLGSNLGLLHCRQTFLPSEPPGKPSVSIYFELKVNLTILKFLIKIHQIFNHRNIPMNTYTEIVQFYCKKPHGSKNTFFKLLYKNMV